MVLDFLWTSGQVLSVLSLLCGAYLVLSKPESLSRLFNSIGTPAPHSLSENDLRLIEKIDLCDADSLPLSGNAAIDTQHQSIRDDTNILRIAILSGLPEHVIDAKIDTLMRDIVRHFKDEEETLAAADYPEAAEHAALHRELLSSAEALVGRFRAGKLGIGKLFHHLAHEFGAKHVLGADRNFIAYIESRR